MSADNPQSPKMGILWMLLTMLLFVSMDACAKYLSQSLHVVEVVWGRYFFHLLLLGLLLAPRLKPLMMTRHIGLQLVRSFLLLLTTASFFTGLQYIPMADASSIMLASPIVVTALSMPILKEKVGPRRWASIAVGCVGAIIIIRPGLGLMQPAALFPLAAAILYGVYQISTRFLSHTESILTTLIYSALIGTLVTTVLVPFFWVTPSMEQWLLMIAMGLFGGLGHFALIKSLTIAPAATVVPFTYSNLIWATTFGFIIFGDLPDQWTVIGAAIIVASGLYIFHREHIRATPEKPD
jgi:drug/metabolite transporter (DMT)-like permease